MGFIFLLLLIPVAVCSPAFLPVDCNDLYVRGFGHSGVYSIYPAGPVSPVQVYCDMGCEDEPDGAKWTVFQKTFNVTLVKLPNTFSQLSIQVLQRRQDGTINFYRGWDQYRAGFGQASGEYWLGLENIHLLTLRKSYELRIDLEDFEGAKAYVHYSSFTVGPEHEGYRLSFSGFKDGGAGNSLSEHHGLKFSTFDKDQDTHSTNCAKTYLGGWWYGECHSVNVNGLYLWGSSIYGIGMNWVSWKGYEYSLKASAIKIRPKQ